MFQLVGFEVLKLVYECLSDGLALVSSLFDLIGFTLDFLASLVWFHLCIGLKLLFPSKFENHASMTVRLFPKHVVD